MAELDRIMRGILGLLVLGLGVLCLPNDAFAQVSNLALGQAKARLACGSGTVVASVFLPNGSLKVTCSQNPAQSSASQLAGSTLTAPTTVAAVVATTFLVVVANTSESGTTTVEASSR